MDEDEDEVSTATVQPQAHHEITAPKHSYSVKIINPSRKTAYSVRKFRVNADFDTPDDIKQQLCDAFHENIPSSGADLEIGYISPGHGVKGQQRWIIDEEDVQDMYKEYKGKNEVLLWFYIPSGSADDAGRRVRSRSPDPGKKRPTKKQSNYENKLDEVEAVVEKLKEKHLGKYPEEKLRMWGHLIQMGKHASYDDPPNLPFFRKGQKSVGYSCNPIVDVPTNLGVFSQGISPSKRLQMRSQCIEQLDRWHALLEKGGITKGQYDELQATIFKDMQNM